MKAIPKRIVTVDGKLVDLKRVQIVEPPMHGAEGQRYALTMVSGIDVKGYNVADYPAIAQAYLDYMEWEQSISVGNDECGPIEPEINVDHLRDFVKPKKKILLKEVTGVLFAVCVYYDSNNNKLVTIKRQAHECYYPIFCRDIISTKDIEELSGKTWDDLESCKKEISEALCKAYDAELVIA